MAFDEKLAMRLRAALKRQKSVTEKKMFGGIAFMLNGNMCCGVEKDNLMLRLGEIETAKALDKRHVRPMDFTGKPMKTMVYVDPAGVESDQDLRRWVRRATTFVSRLPRKKK